MEVKINKDIREFQESIFFGLSMRQCIFSILACGVALLLYFLLKPFFGIETLSWVCILGAVPFAVLGFVKYNGMTAEQFIMAWIRTNILLPSHLHFKSTTYYFELFKPLINRNLKRDFLKNKREYKPKKDKEKKDKKHKKDKKKKEEKIDEKFESNI
ncbi:MAG: PrgI family protein [Clostridia bacterium]|nr:PrgI family protein [Clostridia bacterium]